MTTRQPLSYELQRLVRTIARTVVASYLCALLLEAVFPGFISNRLRLDLFLGIVMISVALWYSFYILKRHAT